MMLVDEQLAAQGQAWSGQRVAISWSPEEDPAQLRFREWLVTNGLGGYASGTLSGLPTRRYHGLFVPNLPAPYGRIMVIPHLEELVELQGLRFHVGELQHEDGTITGQGPRYLRSFELECTVPTWRYDLSDLTLTKSIAMAHGQNTVALQYELPHTRDARLFLRPFFTVRQHHALSVAPPPCSAVARPKGLEFRLDALAVRCVFAIGSARFVLEERRVPGTMRRMDRDRGYDFLEDLYSPGYFLADGEECATVQMLISTEPWAQLPGEQDVIHAARKRARRLLETACEEARQGAASQLVLAADQFIALPKTRQPAGRQNVSEQDPPTTIMAGYPWFTDWGRDSMISLEGLTMLTGRWGEARSILRMFARAIHDGLIPNQFPEGERDGVYNTADATLWYFHALSRYLQYSQDWELLKQLYPALRQVLEQHMRGTRFGISMDPADALLRAGAEGVALTWMDAKVGHWVVTPRRGKPVEIQALWYNALCLMAGWAQGFGEDPTRFHAMADQTAASFNTRFWYKQGGYLYDVVDGPDGDDASLRPNQLLAISLPHPVLNQPLWKPVMDIVAEELLTPLGLRTLTPDHPAYQRFYQGDLRARDAAYHQGTVWPWLIGPFIDAWVRVHPHDAHLKRFLTGFIGDLSEAGMGTISEIFDAEHPFTPRGCVAQAWSVAEVLRAWVIATVAVDPGRRGACEHARRGSTRC